MKLTKNQRGIDDLMKSDGVKKHTLTIADRAAETTRSLASKLNENHVKTVLTEDGAAVVVDSSYWHFDEFGTVKFRARAPLRRGLESVGLKVEGERR